jgi:small subunit ribosomal protein S17
MTEASTTRPPERRRATRIGVVVSSAMTKSVVVRVERMIKHKLYKRYLRRSAKFMAHDEGNVCKVGDTVEIVSSRPLSARKRWRVRRIVRSAVGVEGPQERTGQA